MILRVWRICVNGEIVPSSLSNPFGQPLMAISNVHEQKSGQIKFPRSEDW